MKSNYYRLARIYHPDKADVNDKEAAKEKFHELHRAYSILADPETKKVFDSGGSLSSFGKPIAARWEKYIRTIDSTDVSNMRDSYQGSEAEKKAIFREIIIGKGSLTHLFHSVPFMRYEDEPRIIQIIKSGIECGEIPKMVIRKMRSTK